MSSIYKKKIKEKCIDVYPLGSLQHPAYFCDLMHKKYGHIACVISNTNLEEEEKAFVKGKGEFIHWDEEGYPDIYVKDRLIDTKAMRKALALLETECDYTFNLIEKNIIEEQEE